MTTVQEENCNQVINFSEDEDEQQFASKQQNASQNGGQAQPSYDADDDFFADVNKTQPAQNGHAATSPAPATMNNDANIDLGYATLTKGDDEAKEIQITVLDPRKVGDSLIDTYIVFRVKTVITPDSETAKLFNTTEMIVDRRFSDFLGLYEKIKADWLSKGILVPPPPEKDMKSLAKIKLANTNQDAVELNAIHRRRAALERFMNRIAAHTELIKDASFIQFLTSPTLPSSQSSTRTFSLNGFKKVFKSAEDQIVKLTKSYSEQDMWFDEKTSSVERVLAQYQQLYQICTQLYRSRRELGDDFVNLSKELSALVMLEKNYDKTGTLANVYDKLTGTYTQVKDYTHEQQNIDCFELTEIVGDHVRMLESIKDLLFVRTKAYQACQGAEETLYNKQQQKQRMEAEAKFDKIPKLQFEIAEGKKHVEKAKETFVNLSNTIKKEISVYEIRRVVRMKESIKSYLEQLASYHIKMADVWKVYLNQGAEL